MAIRSICPKCGEEGRQNIHSTGNDPRKYQRKYLYMVHKGGRECYIGRVRTTEQALGELNKPETTKDYDLIIHEIKDYVNSLTRKTIHGKTVAGQVRTILERHGLWY